MPLIPPLSEDDLDPELHDLVQFFQTTLGGVPNSVLTMARRPPMARAFVELNKAVMTDYGAVTLEFKRLVGYVSSLSSGCMYCQAHMILASERFGASEERLNSVWEFETSDHFTEAEKAALAFALAASTVPNAVDDAVMDRLRAHWSEDAICELTGVVSLFGWLNRWNDTMGTPLEELPVSRGEMRLKETTGWTKGKHV